MALSSEMHDRPRSVCVEERCNERTITDVAPHEDVPGISAHGGEIMQIARVRELVEIDQRFADRGEPADHEVGADETGASGDENQVENASVGSGGRSRGQRARLGFRAVDANLALLLHFTNYNIEIRRLLRCRAYCW